jgi:3',5'-cyclic AMP phosphodiesterase CpdA
VHNRESIERLGGPSPEGVVRFVVAGDSGAWPDPTADAIFASLVAQVGRLDPAPAFFANLGDFAGPGTPERHEHYLGLVAGLPVPSLCVVGNHDLDDPSGAGVFREVHGPPSFTFAVGHTRFVALDAAPGRVGEVVIDEPPEGVEGPREGALAYLEEQLVAADEPNRVVLMHIPPFLDGRYAPHADWGFRQREERFLRIVREGGVRLVCAAHGLAFDHCVVDEIHVVMSGGGGTGLCSHLRGICAEGDGRPEDRGALFHCVELSVAADGAVSGRVLQAFGGERFRF